MSEPTPLASDPLSTAARPVPDWEEAKLATSAQLAKLNEQFEKVQAKPKPDLPTPGLEAALAWSEHETHHPHVRVLREEVIRLSQVVACRCADR